MIFVLWKGSDNLLTYIYQRFLFLGTPNAISYFFIKLCVMSSYHWSQSMRLTVNFTMQLFTVCDWLIFCIVCNSTLPRKLPVLHKSGTGG